MTGNEDGVKHCSMAILYSLQHLGYVIPPRADAGWIGEAGPGPSYLDPGSGGAGQRLHQPGAPMDTTARRHEVENSNLSKTRALAEKFASRLEAPRFYGLDVVDDRSYPERRAGPQQPMGRDHAGTKHDRPPPYAR